MKWNKIYTSSYMTFLMLVRRRIVLLLIILIPVIFLSVVNWTSSDHLIPFQLMSLEGEPSIEAGQRYISNVFISVASAGFLISFLALNLVQRNESTNKRLIVCGYSPIELLLSNFITISIVVILISIYITALSTAFIEVEHITAFAISLMAIGFVYGTYALVIGSLIKGELEGILFVVLLANIDAGWLQNPIFYSGADNKEFISYMPAFYPSQSALIASFSDYSIAEPLIGSLIHGLVFLGLATTLFFYKMRLKRS